MSKASIKTINCLAVFLLCSVVTCNTTGFPANVNIDPNSLPKPAPVPDPGPPNEFGVVMAKTVSSGDKLVPCRPGSFVQMPTVPLPGCQIVDLTSEMINNIVGLNAKVRDLESKNKQLDSIVEKQADELSKLRDAVNAQMKTNK